MGYSPDDVEIALQFNALCPLDWLDDNWQSMCDTVLTMTNNQIIEMEKSNSKDGLRTLPSTSMITENDVKVSLRMCKGNIWQAVERCMQRYQDNKAFQSTPTSRKSSIGSVQFVSPQTSKSVKGILSKAKPPNSYSMKILGFGSGRSNNEGNVEDVAEYEVENMLNPENFVVPNEMEYDEADYENEENALIEQYLHKLRFKQNSIGDQSFEFNTNEMNQLLNTWKYEKQWNDQERERMKFIEREKRRMQKMIDLQRRIGGYSSDGTTTEEELDREVEGVFSNQQLYDALKLKLKQIENEDDETPINELVTQIVHEQITNQDSDEDNFDEVL